MTPFPDRRAAGRQLGERLAGEGLADPVVLALPRGGVPVGFEVAVALDAPLDVVVARKIGAPSQPELGVGAVAEGGEPVFDPTTLASLGLEPAALDDVVAAEREELARRVARYRGERPLHPVQEATAIVVDDGLATGATARAALRSLRARAPRWLVLAVPVGAHQTVERLADEADQIICLMTPPDLMAVGQWYRDFSQTDDAEVAELLDDPRVSRRPTG